MDHYAPHPSATFEGYYSKFSLPSGSSIALIVSTVPAAARKIASRSHSSKSQEPRDAGRKGKAREPKDPYAITFTYVSRDGGEWWQREYFPSSLSTEVTHYGGGLRGFRISWDTGHFAWTPAVASADGVDCLEWHLSTPELRFEAHTTNPPQAKRAQAENGGRTPWDASHADSTPAGWMARLPLPIQWHVHSLDSHCDFSLSISPDPDPTRSSGGGVSGGGEEAPMQVSDKDREGTAHVHIEKNWAHSFPESYIWIQAHDHTLSQGICLAGGALFPHVEAYLLTYHSPTRVISFAPPTSVSLPIPWIPWGLASSVSWDSGAATIDIRGWWTRLRITAVAPKDTFFTLSAPLAHGHEKDYTAQSFAAVIKVEVWERSTWGMLSGWMGNGGWRKLDEATFKRGALEMGGAFYKPHTS